MGKNMASAHISLGYHAMNSEANLLPPRMTGLLGLVINHQVPSLKPAGENPKEGP